MENNEAQQRKRSKLIAFSIGLISIGMFIAALYFRAGSN